MSNIFNKVVPKELIKSVQNVMDKEEVNELKAPTAIDREDRRYGEPAKNSENGYTNKDRKNLVKNLRPGFVASTGDVNAAPAPIVAGAPIAAVPATGAVLGGAPGGALGMDAAHVSNVTNSVLRKVAKHRTRNAIIARQSRERGAAPEPKKVNEVVIDEGKTFRKNDETSWKYKKKRSDRKFSRVVKDNDKDDKEQLDIEESFSHRDFAVNGKMHPSMAKHMIKNGKLIDFYETKTGNKKEGTVTHHKGENVHIRELNGPLHKFKISLHNNVNEEEQLDEISQKTVAGYLSKAIPDKERLKYQREVGSFDKKNERKLRNRKDGISNAKDRDMNEEGGAGEIGTDQLVNKYKSVVPGQNGIIKQLKKVMVHEGYVKFDNNTAINIPKSHAKRAVRVYESLKTDEEKIIYESKLIKSVASFQDALNDKNPGA